MCTLRTLLIILLVGWSSIASAASSVAPGGGSIGNITVKEEDGSPAVSGVSTLKVANGLLTDNGDGSVSLAAASGLATTDIDTSAELRAILTDETGTGAAVFATSPTIDAPTITGGATFSGAASGQAVFSGLTSGSFKITTPDATGQAVTLQPAAQTSGAATFTLQDAAGVNQTVATIAQAQTLTNKTLDAEGTGNVITIPKRLWFPAAGCNNATAGSVWDLPSSNPAVAACKTGTNTQLGVLDFADSSNLSAQVTYMLPTTWTGTIDARIKWLTSATTGDVVWQLSTICVADAETDDPAFNTASTVTDAAKGTTLQTNDATITGLTMTGCAAGELLHLKVQRDSAHASDTLAATARLIGVELTIREAL